MPGFSCCFVGLATGLAGIQYGFSGLLFCGLGVLEFQGFAAWGFNSTQAP